MKAWPHTNLFVWKCTRTHTPTHSFHLDKGCVCCCCCGFNCSLFSSVFAWVVMLLSRPRLDLILWFITGHVFLFIIKQYRFSVFSYYSKPFIMRSQYESLSWQSQWKIHSRWNWRAWNELLLKCIQAQITFHIVRPGWCPKSQHAGLNFTWLCAACLIVHIWGFCRDHICSFWHSEKIGYWIRWCASINKSNFMRIFSPWASLL